MKLRDKMDKLRQMYPDAIDIRNLGDCDWCDKDSSLVFFALPAFPAEEIERGGTLMVQGGIFCAECGNSSSGAIPMHIYDTATIPLPELHFDDDEDDDTSGQTGKQSLYHYPKK